MFAITVEPRGADQPCLNAASLPDGAAGARGLL